MQSELLSATSGESVGEDKENDMASNSKREQIILAVKSEVEEISAINTVVRKLPTYEDLKNFALPQLPVTVIVAGLPDPVPHERTRGGDLKDVFLSNLTISLFTYFQDHVNPDTTLSSLLDDLWAKLYADQQKGGLVLNTTIVPKVSQDYWDPFYAFKLDLVLQYSHSKGGI